MNGVKTTKRGLFISGIVERGTYASARETRPISNRAYAFFKHSCNVPSENKGLLQGIT